MTEYQFRPCLVCDACDRLFGPEYTSGEMARHVEEDHPELVERNEAGVRVNVHVSIVVECPECGYKRAPFDKDTLTWSCPACGTKGRVVDEEQTG